MDNAKGDRYFAKRIVEDIHKIEKYAKRVDFSDIGKNEEPLDAINFRLLQIRENAKRLSSEFLSEHKRIDFETLISIRNKATHDYENVSFGSYKTFIEKDLLDIASELEKYIGS